MYLVISKADRESANLAKNVSSHLKKNGIRYVLSSNIELKNIDYELIISIGDDGFILRTFRILGRSQIPVFAIASAQSFLAQANAVNYKHYLNLIKKNKYVISSRSRIVAGFGKTTSHLALNDIGLFSSKSASLLKYSLVIDDESFWKDTSDGLIVATSTGSTGYSLSAGGPIVLNELGILALTSISSLEKHSSLVVSENTKIRIADVRGHRPMLVIDGEVRMPINANEVVIEKSPYPANFVIFSKEYSLESKLKKRTRSANIDKLKNLPASSKLIYKILLNEGNMTQKELINDSMLPERTVRYALDLLLRKGIITAQAHLIDARQTVYSVL